MKFLYKRLMKGFCSLSTSGCLLNELFNKLAGQEISLLQPKMRRDAKKSLSLENAYCLCLGILFSAPINI